MPNLDTIAVVRRLLLALVLLGILATSADLLLLGHYEDRAQFVPLGLNLVAIAAFAWHLIRASGASIRAIQLAMVAFLVAAIVGFVLHYRGNLEFQLEIDASQGKWELFKKVMQAKAPPALAPLVMAQLGLVGLLFTFRHPALSKENSR